MFAYKVSRLASGCSPQPSLVMSLREKEPQVREIRGKQAEGCVDSCKQRVFQN